MAKKKGKAKRGVQTGLFDQEIFQPVDIRTAPPKPSATPSTAEPTTYPRPRIVLGSTWSCPRCGESLVLSPAGGVKCSACWWFQLLGE